MFFKKVYFGNVQFDSAVVFENSVYQESFSTFDSKFQKNTIFTGSQFKGETIFKACNFYGNTNFSAAIFKDNVQIVESIFSENGNFAHASYNKIADFHRTSFHKSVDFSENNFIGIADFHDAIFDSNVDFSKSHFTESIDFGNIKTLKEINFTHCILPPYASFSSGTYSIATKFHFAEAVLPQLINFSNNSDIQNEIDFLEADFSNDSLYSDEGRRWHYLNIYRSNIPKFKIDYQHFRLCFFNSQKADKINLGKNGDSLILEMGHFSIYDPRIYKIILSSNSYKEYLKIIFPNTQLSDPIIRIFLKNCIREGVFPSRLSDDEIIAIYERLLRAFDVQGQKVSYQALDIEYKDFKKGWFKLSHWWNCYKYHKEWIFGWTLLFLFLFTLITYSVLGKLNRKVEDNGVYYIKGIPRVYKTRSFKQFLGNAWYSLMYTSSDLFPF